MTKPLLSIWRWIAVVRQWWLLAQVINPSLVVTIHLLTRLIRQELWLAHEPLVRVCVLCIFRFSFRLSSLPSLLIWLSQSIRIEFKFSGLLVWMDFNRPSLVAGEQIWLIVVHCYVVSVLALDLRVYARDLLWGILLHNWLWLLAVAWERWWSAIVDEYLVVVFVALVRWVWKLISSYGYLSIWLANRARDVARWDRWVSPQWHKISLRATIGPLGLQLYPARVIYSLDQNPVLILRILRRFIDLCVSSLLIPSIKVLLAREIRHGSLLIRVAPSV